ELDHLHVLVGRLFSKLPGVEAAVFRAAAEIGGTDFPDHIGAVLQVVGAQAAFAGVVGKAAEAGATIHRQHGVGRKRAEAHRRNIEPRGIIGLAAITAAEDDAAAGGIDRKSVV